MIKDIKMSDKKPEPTLKEPVSKRNETINKEDIQQDRTEKEATSKNNLQPWQKILLISSLGILFLLTTAYIMYLYILKPSTSPFKYLSLNERYLEHTSQNQLLTFPNLKNINLPRTEESSLNGKLLTKNEMDDLKKRRPVAVMINNHSQARPLSGVSKADIVYEAVVESGITRLMAIFWSEGPTKAGPIRSARQYYLEWLSPFDLIYIHDGCASTSDPRTNSCGNIYSYSIKDIATYGAWRVNDGTRFAPHNEYVSIINSWDYAATLGWGSFPSSTQKLSFKRDAETEDRGEKTHIKIRFRTDLANGGLYDSEFIYDSTSNTYLHKIGGQADLDLETGKQIAAKTVVVEEHTMQNAYDGYSRVIITTTGEGKATIFRDGQKISGKWKKNNRTDRTKYYDSKDVEIEINRGLLWIISLPSQLGDFDIIE